MLRKKEEKIICTPMKNHSEKKTTDRRSLKWPKSLAAHFQRRQKAPGSRTSQFGANNNMKRRCRQPSWKLRRWGGRPRLSGHNVIGTSVNRTPSLAALIKDSDANSMPVVRKSRRFARCFVKPRKP